MNENYKNILEDLTDFGNTLHKQSLKNNFQKRLNITKSKIDTLYNLSFYDLDFSIPNFNTIFLEYKNYRVIKKKVFLLNLSRTLISCSASKIQKDAEDQYKFFEFFDKHYFDQK